MKTGNWRAGIVGLVVAVLTGCGPGAVQASKEFDDAIPEMGAIELGVTGDTSGEGLSTSGLEGEATRREDGLCASTPACTARPEFCSAVPTFLLDARSYVKDLNSAVRRVLEPIAEIVKQHPRVATGTAHVWAPRDVGDVTLRFAMKKAAADIIRWRLEAKAKGADDSTYQIVMAGEAVKGALPRRGGGVMGVDLDRVKALDPSFKGAGQLMVAFKHAGDPAKTTLAYALKGFTVDQTAKQPVTGALHGVKLPNGERRVRLVGNADVRCSATDAKELVLLRARWIPGVGGRADGLALGGHGDVPAGRSYVGNACWGSDFSQGFFLLRDCPKAMLGLGQCNVLQTEGAPSACGAALTSESIPSDDPSDPTAEEGGDALAVPTVMPAGE